MKSDPFEVNPAADKMRGHSKGHCKAAHIDQVSSTLAASVLWLQGRQAAVRSWTHDFH